MLNLSVAVASCRSVISVLSLVPGLLLAQQIACKTIMSSSVLINKEHVIKHIQKPNSHKYSNNRLLLSVMQCFENQPKQD